MRFYICQCVCLSFIGGCGSGKSSSRSDKVIGSSELIQNKLKQPSNVEKKSLVPDSFETVDLSTADFSLRPRPGYSMRKLGDFFDLSEAFDSAGLPKIIVSKFQDEIDGVNFSGASVPVYFTDGSVDGKVKKSLWKVIPDTGNKFFKIEGYFEFAEKTWGTKYKHKYLTAVFGPKYSRDKLRPWRHNKPKNVLTNSKIRDSYETYKSQCQDFGHIVFKFLSDVWDNAEVFFQSSSNQNVKPEDFVALIIVLSDGPLQA